MSGTKDIHYDAPPEEWEELYSWVEKRTASFEETHTAPSNPWLRKERTREEIIKHVRGGMASGFLGGNGGEYYF